MADARITKRNSVLGRRSGYNVTMRLSRREGCQSLQAKGRIDTPNRHKPLPQPLWLMSDLITQTVQTQFLRCNCTKVESWQAQIIVRCAQGPQGPGAQPPAGVRGGLKAVVLSCDLLLCGDLFIRFGGYSVRRADCCSVWAFDHVSILPFNYVSILPAVVV